MLITIWWTYWGGLHPIVWVNNGELNQPLSPEWQITYCWLVLLHFFGSSPPLAGSVWLLNFKERKGMLSSRQGIYALSRLFPYVEVLSSHICDMQRSHHLSNVTHLHLLSKRRGWVHHSHYLVTESCFYVFTGHVWTVKKWLHLRITYSSFE